MEKALILYLSLALFTGGNSGADAIFRHHFENTKNGIINKLLHGYDMLHEKSDNREDLDWSDVVTSDVSFPGSKDNLRGKTARAVHALSKGKGNDVQWENVVMPVLRNENSVNMNIGFEPDTSVIKQEFFPLLNELGLAITDERLMYFQIEVNGHTDMHGDERKNLRLSLYQAISVRDYLISRFHIDKKRIAAYGFGSNLPIISNMRYKNAELNHRIEIRAYKIEDKPSSG